MNDSTFWLVAAGVGLFAMTRRSKKAPRPVQRLPVGGWTAAATPPAPASPRTPSRTNPTAPSRTNP